MAAQPPATAEQLDQLAAALGLVLPDEYREPLGEANGVSANLVQIYAAEEVPERNATYEVAQYAPGCILIGTVYDSPVMLRAGRWSPVFENDWGAMTPDIMTELAPSLDAWIEAGCPHSNRLRLQPIVRDVSIVRLSMPLRDGAELYLFVQREEKRAWWLELFARLRMLLVDPGWELEPVQQVYVARRALTDAEGQAVAGWLLAAPGTALEASKTLRTMVRTLSAGPRPLGLALFSRVNPSSPSA